MILVWFPQLAERPCFQQDAKFLFCVVRRVPCFINENVSTYSTKCIMQEEHHTTMRLLDRILLPVTKRRIRSDQVFHGRSKLDARAPNIAQSQIATLFLGPTRRANFYADLGVDSLHIGRIANNQYVTSFACLVSRI